MPLGYSQSPKLLKGALIRIAEDFLGPIPDIIVFQYNPHTLTRTLKPWGSPVQDKSVRSSATNRAQPFDPVETFQLALELDARVHLDLSVLEGRVVDAQTAQGVGRRGALLGDDMDRLGVRAAADLDTAVDFQGDQRFAQ